MPEHYSIPLACGVFFLSAGTRSTFGFGDALISMPLLSFFLPYRTAAAIVALVSVFTSIVIVAHDWRSAQLPSLWRLVVAASVGIPLGVWCAARVEEYLVRGALGVLVALFALYSLRRPRLLVLRSDRWSWLFGLLAGLVGGPYNTHGPPLVIYGTCRGWQPREFRATIQAYALPAGLLVAASQAAQGFWSPTVFRHALSVLPVTAVALWLGARLHRRIPPERFVRLLYGLLLLMGLLLLGQAASMAARSPRAAQAAQADRPLGAAQAVPEAGS